MNADSHSWRPKGMSGLFIIWLGQMISGITTSMAYYALPFWISVETDASGSALAYWETFFFAAYLFFVLFALFFIDRYPRKPMMLMYDFLLLAATLVLLVLESAGRLEVWHLYLNAVIQGVAYAFRLPAYSSVITILVPRKQNVRANGMLSLLYDLPEIFGPILAGLLFITLGLKGILAINVISFAISIGALLIVEIPNTPYSEEGIVSHIGLLREATYGIKYILKNPGLLGIQLIFFLGNIFSGIALSVTALYTLINLRTGGEGELAISAVQSAGAWAAVVAGLVISVLGGIKHPIRAILWGWILSSLFGLTLLGIGQVLLAWVIASVIDAIFGPVVDVAINNFIQTKVPPDIQGRVFSASEFMAQVPFLFTPLLAAYFGDKVFEPAMQSGSALADAFGWLVGTGPGAGYGLMILLCGIGGTLVGVWGFLSPTIRNANETMPDIILPPPVGLVRKTQPFDKSGKAITFMPKKAAQESATIPRKQK
jgi:MFS family permease